MTASHDSPVQGGGEGWQRIGQEILQRLHGPGGYYNVGNLIGLATGLGLQFSSAAASGQGGGEVLLGYFAGSPQAVALTAATVIFLISGEIYHRAWQNGDAPDPALNRRADLLSAVGAVALAVALVYLGQPFLALCTGLLIVLGKLGSAVFGDGAQLPFWPAGWPDPFRSAVLAARIPGLAAVGLELVHLLADGSAAPTMIQPAAMVICHLLWIRADLLLFRGGAVAVSP